MWRCAEARVQALQDEFNPQDEKLKEKINALKEQKRELDEFKENEENLKRKEEREKAARLAKQREEKEKAELEQSMLTMSEAVDITSSNATAQLKARNRARQQFMKGPQIPYGKTRLQSSHNLKGKIDVPWDYVGGYYNINMPI